jgi:hypothetical protein
MKKNLALLIILLLSGCSSDLPQGEANYPKSRDQQEEERIGKLSGEEGVVLFGGKRRSSGSAEGISVNSYLWRASLDTIYFMPLLSADPFGGTILTDWYKLSPKAKERYKLNIYIIGSELKSDAIRVSAFKQKEDQKGNWVDVENDSAMSNDIENKILIRAREIKVAGSN